MYILVNGHKPDKVNFWIHYLWRLLLLSVIISLFLVFSEEINKRIFEWSSRWIITPDDIYKFINNHWWINFLFFIWLINGCGIYVWKKWKDSHFSLLKVGICIILIILLFKQKVWCYADTPIPGIQYDLFIAIVAILFVIWLLSRCVRFDKDQPHKNYKLVLTSDQIKEVEISPARKAYAELLVEEINKTNLKEETYAIAITGAW